MFQVFIDRSRAIVSKPEFIQQAGRENMLLFNGRILVALPGVNPVDVGLGQVGTG